MRTIRLLAVLALGGAMPLGAQQAAVPPNPAIDMEEFLRSAAAAARIGSVSRSWRVLPEAADTAIRT